MTMTPILDVGGGRWLALNGQVYDLPLGDPVRLDDSNRERWEATARRGGHDLTDLLCSIAEPARCESSAPEC